VAAIDDDATEEVAGAIEGGPGKSRFAGGPNGIGRLNGLSGRFKESVEPNRAEFSLVGLGAGSTYSV
jgi:hypothetical protein